MTNNTLVESVVSMIDNDAAISSPGELEQLSAILDLLAKAAAARCGAVEHRIMGNIEEALELESASEDLISKASNRAQ